MGLRHQATGSPQGSVLDPVDMVMFACSEQHNTDQQWQILREKTIVL